jgi:hypothetical protein
MHGTQSGTCRRTSIMMGRLSSERGWPRSKARNSWREDGGLWLDGESLDLDWVLQRLFAFDEQARIEAERAGAAGAQSD